MYHTGCKAEFKQLIRSVGLTADVFHFFTEQFFRLMQLVPGFIIVVVCTLHTLCSVI